MRKKVLQKNCLCRIGLQKMNLRKMFLLKKRTAIALRMIPVVQMMKPEPFRMMWVVRILQARYCCFRSLQKIQQKQAMLMNLLEKIL